MEWVDRFQNKFGEWYQAQFGNKTDAELTPKDVLYKIIDSMEEFRSEGLDGKIYVPNKYVVEIATDQVEERDYLLSLLDEEELSNALERYMAHKNYFTRGPLDFTIQEVKADEDSEKLYVHAKFEKGSGVAPGVPSGEATKRLARSLPKQADPISDFDELESSDSVRDLPTIERISEEPIDAPTIHKSPLAWAALLVASVDGRQSVVSINKPVFTVGRSRHGGNDLILSADGQISKRHLRIELEPDGGATLYDLASTNGTFVNGKIVPVNVALRHGDIIEIGQTQLQFQLEYSAKAPLPAVASWPFVGNPEPTLDSHEVVSDSGIKVGAPLLSTAKLVKASGEDEYILGTETLIGRSMTCDVVRSEPTVSTQQAKIMSESGEYYIQDLSGRGTTIVNGRPARTGERVHLASGDRISLGGVVFMFRLT